MPRHLGGENLGFADGHAIWANAEAILNGMPDSPKRPVSDAQRAADSNRDNLITGGLFQWRPVRVPVTPHLLLDSTALSGSEAAITLRSGVPADACPWG